MKRVLLIIKLCRGFETGWNPRMTHWVCSRISMKASEKNRVKLGCAPITTQLPVPLEDQVNSCSEGNSRVNRSPQNIGTRIPRIRAIFAPRVIWDLPDENYQSRAIPLKNRHYQLGTPAHVATRWRSLYRSRLLQSAATSLRSPTLRWLGWQA